MLFAIKNHSGLIGIWFAFIVFGTFFAFLGSNIEESGAGVIISGLVFIVLSSAFMLFILPSSIIYYYEQAKLNKYGSYTVAKITNKRMEDYSHNTASFNDPKTKHTPEFLYVIEYEFSYMNQVYQSECFLEHQTTFETITLNTELPVRFLKTNPKKVTLRRIKLANQLGISEKMCQ